MENDKWENDRLHLGLTNAATASFYLVFFAALLGRPVEYQTRPRLPCVPGEATFDWTCTKTTLPSVGFEPGGRSCL